MVDDTGLIIRFDKRGQSFEGNLVSFYVIVFNVFFILWYLGGSLAKR